MEDFRDRDLVIEAAIENMAEKKSIFASWTRSVREHHPGHQHFLLSSWTWPSSPRTPRSWAALFSPVPVMQLVEIVKTLVTSDEVVKTGEAFCKSLGKQPVLCKDTRLPRQRLGMAYLSNVFRCYEQGIARKRTSTRP